MPLQVIHLRNLVFGVNDDEIRELCSQWGQVVAVKSQVRPAAAAGVVGSGGKGAVQSISLGAARALPGCGHGAL